MYVTFGPSCFGMSEAEYAANFNAAGKTNHLTPEQIFAKYNVRDLSQKDYSSMMQDLWSSSDPESGYIGIQMTADEVAGHYADEQSGVVEPPARRYDLLSSTEDSYKNEISQGGTDSGYYLKLYQYLSQACGHAAC